MTQHGGKARDARGDAVVVGGAGGLGRAIAEALAERGESVVIAGRSRERLSSVAAEIGSSCRGLALDLTRPDALSASLSSVEKVSALVLTAAEANENTVARFDPASAARLASIKLTGYTTVVANLASRFRADSAVLMLGGNSKDRPYPGSMTLTTVNAGIAALVRALAVELAPVRVNAIHPGIVADSPAWRDASPEVLDDARSATPTGRLTTLEDIVGASLFALSNPALNGANLNLDGGSSIL